MSESSVEYSLPGILHYLQAEWRKFEREKNEWAIERAELQVIEEAIVYLCINIDLLFSVYHCRHVLLY